jgi:hypothetical protein
VIGRVKMPAAHDTDTAGARPERPSFQLSHCEIYVIVAVCRDQQKVSGALTRFEPFGAWE